MNNAVFRRLLWVAPNFAVIWMGTGLACILYQHIFKKKLEVKYLIPMIGGFFALSLLSEVIHHFFLDSPFDIWDMATSVVASVIVILIYYRIEKRGSITDVLDI